MKEEGLINDEEVLRRLKPHVVSFTNQFLIWVYISLLDFYLSYLVMRLSMRFLPLLSKLYLSFWPSL